MSDPVGQASDLTIQDSAPTQSSTSGEFADSLPDTFAAWLEDLRPALERDKKPRAVVDDTQLPGEVRFEGTLRVDGYLAGRLRSLTGTLFISETGEVQSDVVVGAAIIDGVLHGDIQARERVELQSHAKVFGNIESPAIVIQPRCSFRRPMQFSSGEGSGGEPAFLT